MSDVAAAEGTDCVQFEALAQAVTAARDSDPTEGVERGEQALAQVEALQPACPSGKAMLLGGIGANLIVLGRNKEAIARFQSALEILGETGKPNQIAILNRGIGTAHVALQSYQAALGHYLVSLTASDAAHDLIESAKTASNIGILYMTIGDLEQSRAYLGRSLAGFEAVDFKPGIAGALINLGSVAGKFGQSAISVNDDATAQREHTTLRDLNRRALALFSELDNQRGIAYASSNIGLALNRLGHPQQALPHHQRSLTVRREVGDSFGTVDSLLGIAISMTDLQRHDEAGAALDEAETLLADDAFIIRKNIAAQRVLLAEAQGDYRTALAAQREVTRFADLSADADQMSKIAALQDRFDADQSARQIDLLRSEAHNGDLQLQRQRQVTRLSLLVAVLATGLFLVLLSRYRIGVTTTRQLTVAAQTDSLTGLSNRRHVIELMQYEMNRVERGGRPFCVLMADLDNFKSINDTYGHGAGDAVLNEVAKRLSEAVRKPDSIARWGGEEFLLLLPESSRSGALTLANKLRERIAATPFTVGSTQEPIYITLTLGLSEYQPGMALDDCIKVADTALYQGKESGKNRIGNTGHEPDLGEVREPSI